MQTIEYTTIDKSDWPRGAWDSEPDKRQWIDEATGYPCLIVRAGSSLGHLCGYVGVPRSHPAYGREYNHVAVDVHGGLTFSNRCAEAATPDLWERFKQRGAAAREEASLYPLGDSTRFLAEHTAELNDYDAFVNWCEAAGICHRVENGESDDVWWLGFDCAHLGDVSPGAERFLRRGYAENTYKDFEFVKREVASLAAQLKQAEAP